MKKIKIIIGIVVSLVLIFYSFKNIDWNNFKDTFFNIPILSIVLIIALNILVAFFRAKRWQILLSNIGKVSFIHSFNYTNIGYFINSIFPARAGEIIRPILLAKKINKSKVSVLTTVLVERLFDFVSILVFLLYASLIVDLPGWMKKGGSSVVLLAFFTLIFLFFISKKEELLEKLINVFSFNKKKIKDFLNPKIQNFLLAIKILTHIQNIMLVLFLSAIIWIIYVTSTFIIITSLKLGIDEINASIILLVFISLSMVIPSSPGYFGTYQLASIMALGLFGVSKTEALAVSFLLQLPIYFLNVGLGTFSLWWEGLNLKFLEKTTKPAHDLKIDIAK